MLETSTSSADACAQMAPQRGSRSRRYRSRAARPRGVKAGADAKVEPVAARAGPARRRSTARGPSSERYGAHGKDDGCSQSRSWSQRSRCRRRRRRRAPIPSCALRVGRADGTAGTTYHPLIFTNAGGRACTLRGYPGVSSVTGPHGRQVGAAAARDPVTFARVRLRAARRHRERAVRAGRHGRLRPRALPSRPCARTARLRPRVRRSRSMPRSRTARARHGCATATCARSWPAAAGWRDGASREPSRLTVVCDPWTGR